MHFSFERLLCINFFIQFQLRFFFSFFYRCNANVLTLLFIYCPFLNLHLLYFHFLQINMVLLFKLRQEHVNINEFFPVDIPQFTLQNFFHCNVFWVLNIFIFCLQNGLNKDMVGLALNFFVSYCFEDKLGVLLMLQFAFHFFISLISLQFLHFTSILILKITKKLQKCRFHEEFLLQKSFKIIVLLYYMFFIQPFLN